MKFTENITLRGRLEVIVRRSGLVVERFAEDNLIVTGGRTQMARLLGGDAEGRNITQIAVGTNGTPPALTDTAITNQFKKGIAEVGYPSPLTVRFDWELTTEEANGLAILEFGLLSEDNTLFSRRVRANPINKAEDLSLEGHWTIGF
jgi:hypothetical protein